MVSAVIKLFSSLTPNWLCRYEVEPLVSGFSGAEHKGFQTFEEAEAYMRLRVKNYKQHDEKSFDTCPTVIPPEPKLSNPLDTPSIPASSSRVRKRHHLPPRPRPYPPPSTLKASRVPTKKPKKVIPQPGLPVLTDTSDWDVVYTDGACTDNGKISAKAGIGVWWARGDPRYDTLRECEGCD